MKTGNVRTPAPANKPGPQETAENLFPSDRYAAVGHHRLDIDRQQRTGTPEVIFGASKSVEQISEIVSYYIQQSLPLLVTRVDHAKAAALRQHHPQLEHWPAARVLRIGRAAGRTEGMVAVITAGSSDVPIAEEAALTLDFFGVQSRRIYDCGVAGLHRLLDSRETIRDCDVIIAIAGMEAALASVVGGLFAAPVIAVPTSVGYGASFDGLAALLAMLNSCAPGVTVVNIDNGFGAAVAAASILRVAARMAAKPPTD